MTELLDRAYALLERRAPIVAEMSADQAAAMDRDAAGARDALAAYGIDLTVPEQLDVVVGVMDLLVGRALPRGARVLVCVMADLQHAVALNRHHRATKGNR